MDVDDWRTLLADATFSATHGNQAVGYSLLAQAEAIYDSNPPAYVAFEDELRNARLYVTGQVDRIAVARENATPEDLGIVGSVLTNRTIGDGVSYAGGFAFNLGLIDKEDLQSGQDVEGANRAPKIPVLGGIIRWVREHPVAAGAIAVAALAAPTVAPMILKLTRKNPSRRNARKAKR